MRILEIITVPFFTPRGTSFSSLERTRAFAELGHQVDILTYGIGEDVELPRVRIFRIPSFFVRSLRMGPSLPKLLFDVFLAWKTFWHLCFRGPYDLVHVHEESAYWVAFMASLHRGPVLYDMHSSLVEQLENFGTGGGGVVRSALQGLFRRLERRAIACARVVIVICPDLRETVRRLVPNASVHLIENLPVGWDLASPREEDVAALRSKLGLDGARSILYTGTFGENQGIEFTLDALALVLEERPETRLLLVGGSGQDMLRVRNYVSARGLDARVVLQNPRPYQEMPLYMAAADVLVSPRTRGTNTPLKIYSYLASGKPIVATNLHSHTQVLNDSIACLVDQDPGALAAGLLRVLNEPDYAARIGRAGAEVADRKYGIGRYMREVSSALEEVQDARSSAN